MKKLLLIGDSIRMSYDRYVAMALEGQVQVLTPNENCRFAAYTYYAIGDWEHKQRFGTDVDLVHWNVGLHDVLRFYDEDVLTPTDVYAQYLGRIVRRLQCLYPNAQQIFALTTPVRDEEYRDPWFYRKNRDVEAINAAAKTLMDELGIPVNDLYSVIKARRPKEIFDGAVHYNFTGAKLLAEAVLTAVCPLLGVVPDLSRIRPVDETRTDVLQ